MGSHGFQVLCDVFLFYVELYLLCIFAEVIYIGVLLPQHISVAQLCLEHGKHVLCEKPLCMNLKETSSLIKVNYEVSLN